MLLLFSIAAPLNQFKVPPIMPVLIAQDLAQRVRYLELARAPRFMRNFAEAMYL